MRARAYCRFCPVGGFGGAAGVESTIEETANEMRVGKFALMSPVMTSTEGR